MESQMNLDNILLYIIHLQKWFVDIESQLIHIRMDSMRDKTVIITMLAKICQELIDQEPLMCHICVFSEEQVDLFPMKVGKKWWYSISDKVQKRWNRLLELIASLEHYSGIQPHNETKRLVSTKLEERFPHLSKEDQRRKRYLPQDYNFRLDCKKVLFLTRALQEQLHNMSSFQPYSSRKEPVSRIRASCIRDREAISSYLGSGNKYQDSKSKQLGYNRTFLYSSLKESSLSSSPRYGMERAFQKDQQESSNYLRQVPSESSNLVTNEYALGIPSKYSSRYSTSWQERYSPKKRTSRLDNGISTSKFQNSYDRTPSPISQSFDKTLNSKYHSNIPTSNTFSSIYNPSSNNHIDNHKKDIYDKIDHIDHLLASDIELKPYGNYSTEKYAHITNESDLDDLEIAPTSVGRNIEMKKSSNDYELPAKFRCQNCGMVQNIHLPNKALIDPTRIGIYAPIQQNKSQSNITEYASPNTGINAQYSYQMPLTQNLYHQQIQPLALPLNPQQYHQISPNTYFYHPNHPNPIIVLQSPMQSSISSTYSIGERARIDEIMKKYENVKISDSESEEEQTLKKQKEKQKTKSIKPKFESKPTKPLPDEQFDDVEEEELIEIKNSQPQLESYKPFEDESDVERNEDLYSNSMIHEYPTTSSSPIYENKRKSPISSQALRELEVAATYAAKWWDKVKQTRVRKAMEKQRREDERLQRIKERERKAMENDIDSVRLPLVSKKPKAKEPVIDAVSIKRANPTNALEAGNFDFFNSDDEEVNLRKKDSQPVEQKEPTPSLQVLRKITLSADASSKWLQKTAESKRLASNSSSNEGTKMGFGGIVQQLIAKKRQEEEEQRMKLTNQQYSDIQSYNLNNNSGSNSKNIAVKQPLQAQPLQASTPISFKSDSRRNSAQQNATLFAGNQNIPQNIIQFSGNSQHQILNQQMAPNDQPSSNNQANTIIGKNILHSNVQGGGEIHASILPEYRANAQSNLMMSKPHTQQGIDSQNNIMMNNPNFQQGIDSQNNIMMNNPHTHQGIGSQHSFMMNNPHTPQGIGSQNSFMMNNPYTQQGIGSHNSLIMNNTPMQQGIGSQDRNINYNPNAFQNSGQGATITQQRLGQDNSNQPYDVNTQNTLPLNMQSNAIGMNNNTSLANNYSNIGMQSNIGQPGGGNSLQQTNAQLIGRNYQQNASAASTFSNQVPSGFNQNVGVQQTALHGSFVPQAMNNSQFSPNQVHMMGGTNPSNFGNITSGNVERNQFLRM